MGVTIVTNDTSFLPVLRAESGVDATEAKYSVCGLWHSDEGKSPILTLKSGLLADKMQLEDV